MDGIWQFDDRDFIEKEKLYSSMLLEYTKTHNITALKNLHEVVENIKDSIYPIKYMDFPIKNVADIGSGAGFPAIHLALVLKDVEFTLYEPIKKKSAFLHLVRARLELKNVNIASKRAEQEQSKRYDLITSRAVTNIDALLGICKNLVHEKSRFLLYKGSSVKDELSDDIKCDIYKKNERNYVFIKEFK